MLISAVLQLDYAYKGTTASIEMSQLSTGLFDAPRHRYIVNRVLF